MRGIAVQNTHDACYGIPGLGAVLGANELFRAIKLFWLFVKTTTKPSLTALQAIYIICLLVYSLPDAGLVPSTV